jgi:hypothetical protein
MEMKKMKKMKDGGGENIIICVLYCGTHHKKNKQCDALLFLVFAGVMNMLNMYYHEK